MSQSCSVVMSSLRWSVATGRHPGAPCPLGGAPASAGALHPDNRLSHHGQAAVKVEAEGVGWLPRAKPRSGEHQEQEHAEEEAEATTT